MMHQKKIAKLKKFLSKNLSHSIPINKIKVKDKLLVGGKTNATGSCARKKLSLHHNLAYVSYSIPLLSTFALLLVLGLSFSPDLIKSLSSLLNSVDKTYALDVIDKETVPVNYLTTYNSGSSLTITPAESGGHGATNSEATPANPGTVAYRAHDVQVHVEDARSYALQITYSSGNSKLVLEGGTVAAAYNDIADANGVIGSNIPAKQWGFAWGDKTATDADMTYYKVPQFNQSGTTIQEGRLEVGDASTGTVDFTKKLVFAASFTPNAIAGHYTTSVLLSLSADAKDITNLSEVQAMQSVTPEICENTQYVENTPTVNTYTLTDLRDLKTYQISKLANGDCWMNQNLALDLNDRTLTSADSNVKEDWPSDTGPSTITWSTDISNVDIAKFFNGIGGENYNPNSYGYYYTFGAATAGASKNFKNSNKIVNQDICPKGWRLSTSADFKALIQKKDANGEYLNKQYNGVWDEKTKNFILDTAMGTLSFPAAGYVSNGTLSSADSSGYYWSSNTYSGSNGAYANYFLFNSTNVYPESGYGRFDGRSIRCLAKRLGEE